MVWLLLLLLVAVIIGFFGWLSDLKRTAEASQEDEPTELGESPD